VPKLRKKRQKINSKTMRAGVCRRQPKEREMFKKFTMVDEFIRRSMRPRPIISALPDSFDDEEQPERKLSHLGQSARVTGDISIAENLCIDGAIEGTIKIRGKRLSVTERALVKGEIHARTIDVHGTVQGDIHGDEIVHLYASASVTGNVHTKRILVDDGAQFDGTLKTQRDVVKPAQVKSKAKTSEPEETTEADDDKPKLRSVGS